MSEGPKRSQAARRRAAKEALIEAASTIAVESGVGAVTFDAIGRRAGYSRGLATQHFGSKRGLITAVINDLHMAMEEDAVAQARAAAAAGQDALDAYVTAYFKGLRSSAIYQAYFLFLSGIVSDRSEMVEMFADSHQRVRREISALARGTPAEKDDPSGARDDNALALGALLMGVSIQTLVDPSTDLDAMERRAKRVARALFTED
ncbi:MAG: TetR/AcrR family transcriptional regulator [Pseudomonadota bacterium]